MDVATDTTATTAVDSATDTTPADSTAVDAGATGRAGTDNGGDSGAGRARTKPEGVENADSMAVASFVMGLVGLLVFNLFLGPCALVLGGLALARNTTRRGRALFGTALGAADLVVLAVTVTANGTVSWNFAG
ncbi:DUF4190 domain-containing protein [Streptomyces iconiensis]|uniref:DUF4190 domain-containing protein n=1 Tax=Streptomyces iconiensis TaxID=1384038 RepID=A0ABT6ZN22_9ACTN|nr:DUF4190 domain-containing protein [Streptomyces iconiensis]MDJ1130457.1 DUF4190 domain-containing protein [Streptomyces iconiensis]